MKIFTKFILTLLLFSSGVFVANAKSAHCSCVSPMDITVGGDVITFEPVFPNPASQRLTVNYKAREEASFEIKITNIIGTTVRDINEVSQVGTHSIVIPIQDLPAGVYFVTYFVKGMNVKTERLVIRS